ncbi:hypothetical protein AAG570_002570 [Ranatra chinensis]|uniref:Oxidoreductase FAD/NAD(P)-binding domain-containing protein n=1 Tax=Ranatra chinensis TaxID=642074 RepID=A0ABD0Y7Z1_9HEMI
MMLRSREVRLAEELFCWMSGTRQSPLESSKGCELQVRVLVVCRSEGSMRVVILINFRMNVALKFFNKTEQDIVWKTEFNKLSDDNRRFSVEHILSEGDESWKGRRGWMTPHLLGSLLNPSVTANTTALTPTALTPTTPTAPPTPPSGYVCVCGPITFTQLTERYLQDMGYTSQNYFCFKG